MGAARGLTKRTIDALKPGPERYVHWDHALVGFGVRVSTVGTKTYIYKYRLPDGRVRWKDLGRVGAVPLAKARKQAKTDTGIVSAGKDPQREIDEAKAAVALATVADEFLTDHAEARRKPSTVRLYKLAINGHIKPALGALPVASITDSDAARLHHRLRGTPVLANRCLAVLSSLLAWSVGKRYRTAGPNPCAGLEKFAERKRKRYLDGDEYARLGKALTTATMSPAPRTAIELLLLTGARPAEIATLQWAHVNLKTGTLDLPDSKTGAKTIHLPPAAAKLLKKWPRFAKSDYVFPGNGRRKKGDHLHPSTLAHVWADLRTTAGLEDVRLYDACRHSFASVAVSKHGLSLAAIGEQLGHSQPATTARYAHLHDEVAKQNAKSIGTTIARALKRKAR